MSKFSLSEKGAQRVEELLERQPTREAAIIPTLRLAQIENGGWVSDEVIVHLSEVMSIDGIRIKEVRDMYPYFHAEPVGKFHFQFCGGTSCESRGAGSLIEYFQQKMKVEEKEITPDGLFSFERVGCFSSCQTGPNGQVNTDPMVEGLTLEKLDEIVREYKKAEQE